MSPAVSRFRRCLGGPTLIAIAVTIGLTAALTGAVSWAGALPEPQSVLSRDAIWRTIFARPDRSVVQQESDVEGKRRALGARLFEDPRLSDSGMRACSSCHQPDRNFTDGLETAMGLDGKPLKRHTPHLWNLADATAFLWDGRAASFEQQARGPLFDPNELGATLPALTERLSADPIMAAAFAAAFPERPAVTEANILAALAAYEKTLVSPETRFDAWVKGDDPALSPQEKEGFAVFVGRGGCVSCHGGWRLTDDQFHDIGLTGADPGRGAVPGGTPGLAAFKTPGLRQVSKTAPYMHDGRFGTLDDVVAHYAGGRTVRPSLSPNIVRDLDLDAVERAALVAFLKTL